MTAQVKAGMMQEGSMMITYNPEGKYVNFFRMVVTNRNSTIEDMDFVVEEIARLGKDLWSVPYVVFLNQQQLPSQSV